MAEVSIKGCHLFITKRSKRDKTNASAKEIKNLKCATLLFDNKIGKNNNVYPISVPMQAVGTQKIVFVYTAQVKSSKQIEIRLVRANTSNFLDWKNDVKVGTKE